MLQILLFVLAQTPAPGAFDAHFTGRTLRADTYHSGTASEEHFALARLRLEGEWPGSRTQLVDGSNLGKYRVSVADQKSGATLYSRGFASIFGEWETTGEAKQVWGTFEESQRIPEPKHAVRLTIEKRGDDGAFRELWSTAIDPASRFVDRSAIAPLGESFDLAVRGASANHVDLLVVGEGYTAAQRADFRADAERLVGVLLATEPFARHARDFNVRALHVPSQEPGISNPRKGVWRDSPLGLSYNAFDSDRYVLTFEDRVLREAAAQVPYDALIVLFNEKKYGGGGIYNLWATCAADSEPAPYVFVHEFGHSFAGLDDEYYTSQVAYEQFIEPGVEPWAPNVTALLDPAKLKWRDLVAAGTPLPTPWKQAEFDAVDLAYQKQRQELIEAKAPEEASEALMREVKAATAPLLGAERFHGVVGAFEGAAYQAKGLYRPEIDCIMFTRNPTSFCKVCERAVEQAIERYTR